MDYFAKRIIPCLDVKDGRVVKGVNFVGLKDAGDPVEIAKRYNEEGADELTFLDITASHEERDTIVHIVEQVAKEVFIPLTVGGGIRKLDDIYKLLNVGCDKVSVNSAAVKRPDLINEGAKRFGSQCIVVAIDVKKTGDRYHVYLNGGRIDSIRALTPSSGPKRPSTGAPARFSSPPWTLTAPRRASTFPLPSRSVPSSTSRSSPAAVRGRWAISKRPSNTVRTRPWRPVFSTSKRSTSWSSSTISRITASRCGSEMSEIITFSPEEKAVMVEKMKAYFARELDQEIGGFDAEFLLDFFAEEIGVYFYNKGLNDALDEMRVRIDTIADDVGYTLEKNSHS